MSFNAGVVNLVLLEGVPHEYALFETKFVSFAAEEEASFLLISLTPPDLTRNSSFLILTTLRDMYLPTHINLDLMLKVAVKIK